MALYTDDYEEENPVLINDDKLVAARVSDQPERVISPAAVHKS